MRVMKKTLPSKRLNMPGDKETAKILDFDEQDNFSAEKGGNSPKTGSVSPKHD